MFNLSLHGSLRNDLGAQHTAWLASVVERNSFLRFLRDHDQLALQTVLNRSSASLLAGGADVFASRIDLSESANELIRSACRPSRAVLFNEPAPGRSFKLVLSGSVDVFLDDQCVDQMVAGDSFWREGFSTDATWPYVFRVAEANSRPIQLMELDFSLLGDDGLSVENRRQFYRLHTARINWKLRRQLILQPEFSHGSLTPILPSRIDNDADQELRMLKRYLVSACQLLAELHAYVRAKAA